MFNYTGANVANDWCIYTLHNREGQLVFLWCSKLSAAFSWRDALSNPAFDATQSYSFTICALFPTQREAMNAVTAWLKANPWPPLNKTVRWNRRTMVKCVETGQTWRSAAECAKQLGINPGQLSQHLRRNPGYKTIKQCTFINIPDERAVAAGILQNGAPSM